MNWEHEKAKRDLEEFWDYAHELYEAGNKPMDALDAAKLAQLKAAIGDSHDALFADWKQRKGLHKNLMDDSVIPS